MTLKNSSLLVGDIWTSEQVGRYLSDTLL